MTYYIAEVLWESPQGRLAPTDRLLSLPVHFTDGSGYVGFNNDCGETYLFSSRSVAEGFRRTMLEKYAAEPQYFVIDDKENTVSEGVKPVIAWQPYIKIEEISEADAREAFPNVVEEGKGPYLVKSKL
jgi:hypothetical protein